jgi:uncharacterized membrane protein YgcG
MKRIIRGLAVFLGILTGFLVVLFLINPDRPVITGNVIIEGQGPVTVIGNLIELKFNDTENAVGERWARGGISLSNGTGIFTDDKIQILEFNNSDGNYYEHDADVWIQTRRGGQINDTGKEVWFLGYTFKIDELDSNGKSFFIHYGVNVNRINSGNVLTISDLGNLLRIQNSSGLIYDINKSGFDIFNRIDLGGQEIISSGNSNGFVVRDLNGVNYSTANSIPVITVEEDGKVHKALRIEGNFSDTSGNKFLGYVARMFLYHDGKTELSILLQNKGDYDRNVNGDHKRFKTLYADLNLNLGSQKDLQLTEFYNTQYTNEKFRAYQDFNVSTQDHSALSYGQDPTNSNMMDNFYVRVIDNSENTVYLEADEPEGQDGTRSNGLIAVSDGNKKFSASVEDFWRDSPKTIEVENNRVKIGLFGEEHETQNILVHDQGPILKTYTGNTQYDHNTFQGSSYTNYASEDLGNYILHKGVQEYEKMFFDFSLGAIDQSKEINFSKGVQTQTIGLPNGSYYRLSGANANRFRYFEDRNWNTEDINQTTRDAGAFMLNWQKALWDENYVTQPPLSGYPYLPSFVNRIKMGTDASGSFGRPHYGWPYSGQLFWQGEGWQNNGFGSVNGIITAIMRSEDHKGFSELDNVIKHNSMDAFYVWENTGDAIAGSVRHEKGNSVYGYYQNTNPNSPRHQWEDLIPIAKLLYADENMKESLLYSTVDFANGYPHVPTGQAGRAAGIVTLTNSVSQLGPLGPQLKNLVGYYQLTGDIEYVRIAKEYVKTLKAISEFCELEYGVKIIHSPNINQNMNQSGQNQWGNNYDCTPSVNNQEQFFTTMYLVTGIIEVLEADYQINGFYDTGLRDFYVLFIKDYYDYLVKPYIPVQPANGVSYNPITTYNDYHIEILGTTPSAGCIFNSNLSNGYELHQCNSGEMTGTAMTGGEVLPWLYYQTNVTEYLDSAEIITRDHILYRSRGGMGGLTVSFGDSNDYGSIAWRHLSGLADVKIFMPQTWKFLPFFNVKLGGVGESIGTNLTILSCSGSLSCSQVGVCSGTQASCLNLNWVCDYVGNNASYESTESLCSDGLDNDCDGLIDSLDSDCETGGTNSTNTTTGGTGGNTGGSSGGGGGGGGSSGGGGGSGIAGNVVNSPESNAGNEEEPGVGIEEGEGGEGVGVGAGITGLFVDESESLDSVRVGALVILVVSLIVGLFWYFGIRKK